MNWTSENSWVGWLGGALCLGLAACVPAGSGSERGGPQSLGGFRWTGPAQTVNGIELQPEFSFDAMSVTARNTCNRTLSVMTTAPARYRYTGNVPSSSRREESSNGANCVVEILAGTIEFEIVDNVLRVTGGGSTIDFQPSGSVAGLYGTWTAEAPGVGRLSWSMGGGRIRATATCSNGVSATTDAAASFVNILEITADASNSVEEAGLTCNVGIARGTYTYTFDGADMILSGTGGTIRFIPNPR